MANIPPGNILKGHPVKQIHWKYRVEMENMKNDKGYESDGGDSNTSVKTVTSLSADDVNPTLPQRLPSPRQEKFSRRTTAANSLQSSAQVNKIIIIFHLDDLY